MEREDHPKNLSVNLDDHMTASLAGRVSRLSGHTVNATPEPGALLGNRFLLQRLIGRGGSGAVFVARDQRLGERVAVKVLHPEAATPEGRERVRREVRAARSHHPHLVRVHDLHETDGLVFLSLELVEGRSLREMIADQTRLGIDEGVSLGRQLADALAHLHHAGIVHRDVKPGNVLVTPEGVAKLCDLGLARPYQRGGTVTETAMVMGTPAYMAPEQGRSAELTPASDVYGLGVTLHHALTGKVPLEGETGVATLIRRQQERPPSVRRGRPEAPPWLDRLITQMLDPDPRRRPTAADVAHALQQRRFRPRLGRRLATGTLAIIAIAAVAGTLFWSSPFPLGSGIEPDSPEARLATRWRVYDDRSLVEVFDGAGRRVHTLATHSKDGHPDEARLMGVQRVAVADLDQDGLDDLTYTDGDPLVEHQLLVYLRQRNGNLELARQLDIRAQRDHQGRRFADFRPRDVQVQDVTGDGRPEILLVQYSHPFHPALARVFATNGREHARIWHPGHLTNVRTGDRDRDGRVELYLGGTTDFRLPRHSEGSHPVLLVVEADWNREDLEIDLFGPDESFAASVPSGVEAVYLGFSKQTLLAPLMIWEHSVVRTVRAGSDTSFLDLAASRTPDPKKPGRKAFARIFFFGRDLRLTRAMWDVSILKGLGVAQDDPRARADLSVRYWNGAEWQDEVCAIPEAADDPQPGNTD